MSRRIIGIFMCLLMIGSAFTAIVFHNETKVEAIGGGGGGGVAGLPYDYLWNKTQLISNVIKDAYHGPDIRMGRAFGSKGDYYTAYNILRQAMNATNLSNVHTEKLGPINRLGKFDWNYNMKVEATDFQLTINNASNNTYPYPRNVPKNETFAFASGAVNNIVGSTDWFSASYKRDYTNLKIVPLNISRNWNLTGGRFTNYFYNITDYEQGSAFSLIVGNATYVPQNESLPSDQEGRFFLIDEVSGCENKLNNITNATGVFLINDNTRYNVNLSNYMFQIARIQKNKSNMSTIINLLKNGTYMLADNVEDSNTITFTYNFSNSQGWWPKNEDFVILCWMPPPDQVSEVDFLNAWRTTAGEIWALNFLVPFSNYGSCYGFVLYSAFPELHYMEATSRAWMGYSNLNIPGPNGSFYYYTKNFPHLQAFSVNKSVGEFLQNHPNYTTISGHMTQEYKAVDAYNVVGNITIPHSPQNKIVVLANRFDGWQSQASGDSGGATAALLGIANYMKDNHITPKYNLTFLFDTGEEYGFRGAWYYNDSHQNNNIIRWIGLEQIGFTEHNNKTFDLEALCKDNDTTGRIIWNIVNQSNYETITGNEFKKQEETPGPGKCDDVAWLTRPNCDTLCFAQGGDWNYHHTTGLNFNEGDAIKNMNRTELNYTFDIIWNVTKYFTVNPNCHFHTVSYVATSTTGGTMPDSIKATFTVKSVLPSDLIMVNASLYNATTDQLVPNKYQEINFVVDKTGVERNITLSMPAGVKEDDYYIKLNVYNSTARINRTLGYSYSSNDTETSPTFHLNKYHTLGDIRIGTSTANAQNVIRGSKFTVTEDARVNNITAYVYGSSTYPPTYPTYQCMIYRISDGHLMAASNKVNSYGFDWLKFNFTSKPLLVHNTQYMLCIWGNTSNAIIYSTPQTSANGYANSSYTFGTPPQTITWELGMTLQQYSIFCWYNLDTTPPHITDVTASPYRWIRIQHHHHYKRNR
jgi:hypothetical protein